MGLVKSSHPKSSNFFPGRKRRTKAKVARASLSGLSSGQPIQHMADPEAVLSALVARRKSVLREAERQGFLKDRDDKVASRINPDLLARAKANTGITSTSELIEFALSSLALEDNFPKAFAQAWGTIDSDLDLSV